MSTPFATPPHTEYLHAESACCACPEEEVPEVAMEIYRKNVNDYTVDEKLQIFEGMAQNYEENTRKPSISKQRKVGRY
jgi:hypothetical protein